MSQPETSRPFNLTKGIRTCRVRNRHGRFYLLKVCPRKARVLAIDQPGERDFLVSKTDLRDIQERTPSLSLFPNEPDPPDPDNQDDNENDNELPPLPYGIQDLDDVITADRGPPVLVKCFVRECQEMLRPPTRGFHGDSCQVHGIHCHFSGSNVTYTYRDPRRNLIASPELFATKVRRNPHKTESHRFGYANSEDAVSWCVFRSLQEAKALHLTEAQHEELLEVIRGLQGKVMLSGYACELYDSKLTNWHRHEFDLPNNAASGVLKRRMTEVVWANFHSKIRKEVA